LCLVDYFPLLRLSAWVAEAGEGSDRPGHPPTYTLLGYGMFADAASGTEGSVVTSETYQVTGMTCEHCVHAVTAELERLDGVREVAVELVAGGRSAVTVTSDRPVPAAAVAAALDEAGDYRLAGS
jgi:copper chaperone